MVYSRAESLDRPSSTSTLAATGSSPACSITDEPVARRGRITPATLITLSAQSSSRAQLRRARVAPANNTSTSPDTISATPTNTPTS